MRHPPELFRQVAWQTPVSNCPQCDAILLIPEIRFTDSFRCRECGTLLSVAKGYFGCQAGASCAASIIGCYLLGLRGLTLVACALLSWAPASVVVIAIGLLFFPPRLQICNDQGPWISLNLK